LQKRGAGAAKKNTGGLSTEWEELEARESKNRSLDGELPDKAPSKSKGGQFDVPDHH